MPLITTSSTVTFKIPCQIPTDILINNGLYNEAIINDDNTCLEFENADMQYHHLRKIEVMIRDMCDKFPDDKYYKRLRADVCQMVHSHS